MPHAKKASRRLHTGWEAFCYDRFVRGIMSSDFQFHFTKPNAAVVYANGI